MKTIVITGPSGSGKTFLARKIASIYKDSIICVFICYLNVNPIR